MPENSTNPGARTLPHGPIPAHADQDILFRGPFDLLRKAIRERVFPAASVAVTCAGRLVCLKAFGRFTYEADTPETTEASIFDLASLTKIVATTSMAMVLYERGLLDLEMPVVSLLPEFKTDDPRRQQVTLRMLLDHSSGLAAYEKLFLRAKDRDALRLR